jgi:hypothetical protein
VTSSVRSGDGGTCQAQRACQDRHRRRLVTRRIHCTKGQASVFA